MEGKRRGEAMWCTDRGAALRESLGLCLVRSQQLVHPIAEVQYRT